MRISQLRGNQGGLRIISYKIADEILFNAFMTGKGSANRRVIQYSFFIKVRKVLFGIVLVTGFN
ncbi:hypothetical protein MKP07_18290 [Niabella hibiscisoli]|nr:hypothetical protein [Niabella hibiscisoli]MCH5718007.1 hypothetical protein [Niabella hibiscisoli]